MFLIFYLESCARSHDEPLGMVSSVKHHKFIKQRNRRKVRLIAREIEVTDTVSTLQTLKIGLSYTFRYILHT